MKSLFAFFTVCSTQKSGNGTENCWFWWGVVVYGADFDDNFYTFDYCRTNKVRIAIRG